MKQLIQKTLYGIPGSYHLLSKISKKMGLYSEDQNKIKQILNQYFTDRKVQNGPFAGMNYIDQAHGSSLLPKLAGTYEYLLHTRIADIIDHQYVNIIDIGSAEGYYAVGLALKTNSKIYAFDESFEAQRQLKELANANNCLRSIEINGLCADERIDKISASGKTLIICDIEGSEEHVLNNNRCISLNQCDILVECHDFIKHGVCDTLIRRFQHTHTIEIICDQEDIINENTVISSLYKNDFDYIISENRAVDNMKRLLMKTK